MIKNNDHQAAIVVYSSSNLEFINVTCINAGFHLIKKVSIIKVVK